MSGNLLHPDAIKDDQKEKKKKTSKKPRTSQQVLRSLFLSLIALALIVTASFVHKYYNGNLQEEETNDQAAIIEISSESDFLAINNSLCIIDLYVPS